MEENIKYKDNIVHDSYYLVNLFKKAGKPVTQLQIQKIMYFFEAYYMCEKNVDQLYECNFNAWMFGPVAIPLHKEYKIFEGRPIVLTEEKENIGNKIDEEKRKIMNYIFEVFGELTPKQLVNLTHRVGSPWHQKWLENGKKVVYVSKSYIDKKETKKWFKENFLDAKN